MRGRWLAAVAPLALLVACGSAAATDGGRQSGPGPAACEPWDGGPTDVPFSLAPLLESDGDGGLAPFGVRFALQFEIGDAGPIDAFLDTGSSGIQLIQDAASPAVIAALDGIGTAPVTEEFVSGVEATGVVALATVTLGGLTTPAPIPIFLIQKLSCAKGFPCASAPGPLQQDVFNGFPAIVGIGMRGSPLAPGLGCPISRLPGNPPFIVKAPAFGGDAGTLRIGPSAAEVAAYQTLQLQAQVGAFGLADCLPVWDDTAIPACVDDQSNSTQYCADSVLDTGGPAALIEWQGYQGPEALPPGSNLQISVGAAPLEQFDVLVSANPQAGQDLFVVLPSTLGANLINLGTTLFYRYDVYFDQAQGRIGLLPH